MPLATTPSAPTRRPRMVAPTHEDEALRLLEAMDAYKRSSGRLFPTWSEVLEVVRSLGYEKPARACSNPPPSHFPPLFSEQDAHNRMHTG